MGICVKELPGYWVRRARMPECSWTMPETGHVGLIALRKSMSAPLLISS